MDIQGDENVGDESSVRTQDVAERERSREFHSEVARSMLDRAASSALGKASGYGDAVKAASKAKEGDFAGAAKDSTKLLLKRMLLYIGVPALGAVLFYGGIGLLVIGLFITIKQSGLFASLLAFLSIY